MKKIIFPLALSICLLVACLPSNQYMQKYFFKHNIWRTADRKQFSFTITDTSKQYNWFYLMQHGKSYPYGNIWLRIYTTYPSGAKEDSRQEIPLCTKEGVWFGRTNNGITDHKINIGPNQHALKFSEKGTYTFIVEQDMRTDSLTDVYNMGMLIEKVN